MLPNVYPSGGYTATALALALTRLMLDPFEEYGARPISEGIPRVAVLITDGMANLYPINVVAPALQNSGVQVQGKIICVIVRKTCLPGTF